MKMCRDCDEWMARAKLAEERLTALQARLTRAEAVLSRVVVLSHLIPGFTYTMLDLKRMLDEISVLLTAHREGDGGKP